MASKQVGANCKSPPVVVTLPQSQPQPPSVTPTAASAAAMATAFLPAARLYMAYMRRHVKEAFNRTDEAFRELDMAIESKERAATAKRRYEELNAMVSIHFSKDEAVLARRGTSWIALKALYHQHVDRLAMLAALCGNNGALSSSSPRSIVKINMK